LQNRTANAFFAERDGLTVEHHQLHAARTSETAALQGLIYGSIHTANGSGLHAGGAHSVSAVVQAAAECVGLTGLARRCFLMELEPAALVFVSDPERAEEGMPISCGGSLLVHWVHPTEETR